MREWRFVAYIPNHGRELRLTRRICSAIRENDSHHAWSKTMMDNRETLKALERILSHTIPVTESGCWIWMGTSLRNGYGRVWFRDSMWLAHRAVFTLVKGEISEGFQIDHLCKITYCVNPSHLESVPPKTNIARSTNHVANFISRHECSKGHLLTGENLIIRADRNYSRACRTCEREWKRISRERASERI